MPGSIHQFQRFAAHRIAAQCPKKAHAEEAGIERPALGDEGADAIAGDATHLERIERDARGAAGAVGRLHRDIVAERIGVDARQLGRARQSGKSG